jgi:hypothetical protein
MPPMTTEQRITFCFQCIQGLESSRANIIECKQQQAALLLDPLANSAVRTLAANILQQADAELIQIYNQQEALRRLAEYLQGLLAQHPRPTSG